MIFDIFKKPKGLLGIDVGTFSIKVVQLSYSGKNKEPVLENYGERVNSLTGEDIYKNLRKKNFILSFNEVSNSIKDIMKEAGIKEKKAVFSIPEFMSFFTVMKLPSMLEKEISSVVQFEARQHIPLPLDEVFLDWSVISKGRSGEDQEEKMRILLVAVPKQVISEFQELAKSINLESFSMEASAFSLARSLVKDSDLNKVVQLIDIGVQSTSISIVDAGMVKSTYTVDFSDNEVITYLASKLGVGYNEAEKIKAEQGLVKGSRISEVMESKMSSLLSEGKRVAEDFFHEEEKGAEKIILSGGAAFTPGLKEYFEEGTEKETEIADPFRGISYPGELEGTIKGKIGPRYSVAVGLALKNLED